MVQLDPKYLVGCLVPGLWVRAGFPMTFEEGMQSHFSPTERQVSVLVLQHSSQLQGTEVLRLLICYTMGMARD